jgi:uncharacterized protein
MHTKLFHLLFYFGTSQGWIAAPGVVRWRHSNGARHSKSSNSDDYPTNPVILIKSGDGTNEWISPASSLIGAEETWRWCKDFVVPLNLCPWAAASVRSKGALKIYVVDQAQDVQNAVEDASKGLREAIATDKVDSNVAISFIVTTDYWEFGSFYSWFLDLEEAYLDDSSFDDVTLAPFHPDWLFQGDEPELAFEKKSPYATVSVVSRAVIDKAGNEATAAIAGHNEGVLMSQGFDQLNELYQRQVKLPPSQDAPKK